MNTIYKNMRLALEEAKKSSKEIPVGCLITDREGNILSLRHNEKEFLKDPTAHAEILAIKDACSKLNNWRLEGCNLFVTLEPCPMCAWAILNTGLSYVYFGAHDINYGAFGGSINLMNIGHFKTVVKGGFLENECEDTLKKWFKEIR